MIAGEVRSPDAIARLDRLSAGHTWRSVLVVVDDHPDPVACSYAKSVARRNGARVVLYDARASSGWSSPFPPDEQVRPLPLEEAGIRRSGRNALADVVRDLGDDGVRAAAYLSAARHADDLTRVVRNEGTELVICSVPLKGRLLRNVHLSRREGASLLTCSPAQQPALYPPLDAAEPVPIDERVQIRFLVGLLLTFLVARLRNSASSRS